ncbi:MAG: hypothetical protein ACKOQM_11415 [Novosphingobium sp.]
MLLLQPATCLDPEAPIADVMIGRALFTAPNLLGGQAERAAVSCASCHANGRRNRAFYLARISAEPGTADVSSSFFSLARADGKFDPRRIPDLAQPGKVSRDKASGALEAFIRGLIVEEFSGREPSNAELSGLATYVRAVRTCAGREAEPLTLASDLDLVRTSITAASLLAARGDLEGAKVAAKGARYRLGLISERFAGPQNDGLRARLGTTSRRLSTQPLESKALTAWLNAFDRDLVPQLRKAENRSLYDRKTLELWLAQH